VYFGRALAARGVVLAYARKIFDFRANTVRALWHGIAHIDLVFGSADAGRLRLGRESGAGHERLLYLL
jgi:hypothetical protein